MSRLVAGAGLKPDEVRIYAGRELEDGEPEAKIKYESDRHCHTIEYESIDILELAPIYLLLAAQEKAQATIAQAEATAHEIREQARAQGEVEGREQGQRDLLPALVAFADAGQSLIVFEERLLSQYAPHLVQLALAIAAKIVGRSVDADAQVAASVLERARAEVAYAKQLRIWLHPDDLKIIQEIRPDLLRLEGSSGRTLEVIGAAEVSRGGCRLETESGVVDATIPTQLSEIRRQLLDDATAMAGVVEPPV